MQSSAHASKTHEEIYSAINDTRNTEKHDIEILTEQVRKYDGQNYGDHQEIKQALGRIETYILSHAR